MQMGLFVCPPPLSDTITSLMPTPWRGTRSALSLIFNVVLSQAGTWDPLLQCLHLDKPLDLLELQKTKKS